MYQFWQEMGLATYILGDTTGHPVQDLICIVFVLIDKSKVQNGTDPTIFLNLLLPEL
jgi:hypothetical protein